MSKASRDTLTSLSQDLSRAVADASVGLVTVHDGRRILSGIIWREGLIVTADEAIQGEEDLKVTLPDDATVSAEMLGRDPSTDVALLKAETGSGAPWTEAVAPPPGALALAIGRGQSGPTATFGVVAEAGGAWTSENGGRIDAMIRLSFTLPHRIEGGAIVSADGGLLGLAAAGPGRQALVIPTTTVERAVSVLSEKGYVARGYLGVSLHPMGRNAPGGALVFDVAADSPAARAGFLIGDIVATWNGEPVQSVRDIARRLGTGSVGEQAKLGLVRAGKTIEKTVVIGERRRERVSQ